MEDTTHISHTCGYLLTKLGQAAFDGFAEKLAPLGLRPKHCGTLALLAALKQPSQQSLGKALGVVPSAMVGVLDDLEGLGAIRRVADPDDRRKFSIELTPSGGELLRSVTRLAKALDAELLVRLSAAEQKSLQRLLAKSAGLGSGRGGP
ncbi:MAG: MarR family transcriptional regulator [Pseudomonadota bacterium]